ncbi:MAG: HEPN domain-containing protein [Methanomassiliicoccaceae archaeon]|nr:HEPN domain-containing protein [Methanomassiliicoccaceae archaeon]
MVLYEDIDNLRQIAAEDLWVAEMILDSNDELLAHIGFNLQQYVEKMMKASLQEHDIDYPKTHDLVLLLELFPQEKVTKEDAAFAYILSRFSVETRYRRSYAPPMDGKQIFERAKRFAAKIETLW